MKRHGSTTSLILEFLELMDNEERIKFLQKHQAQIDSRFLTAAAESLEFAGKLGDDRRALCSAGCGF